MRFCFFLLLVFSSSLSFGQRLQHTQQYWTGYMTQGKISDRWSLWNDSHWVPESFFLLRTGATYHFKSKHRLSLTAGFAKLWIYPAQPYLHTFRPENRPWAQIVFQQQPNVIKHLQRFRVDARFRRNIQDDVLQEGFNFNWRLRYMYQARYDFNPNQNKNYFYTSVSNEVLFNLGNEIENNFRMDQNRLQLALGFQKNQMAFQLGYMNFMTLSNQSSQLTMKHTLTAWVFHAFDF